MARKRYTATLGSYLRGKFQMVDIAVDESLDACGLSCPLPLLKAKQALNKLASGQVLAVVCTDPGSVRDFQVFARQSGHELLDSKQSDEKFQYWLKKA